MYLFEGIDALLQVDVIRWKLGLDTMYQLRQPNSRDFPRAKESNTLSSAVPSCSLTYCWVRAANGENEDLPTIYIKQTILGESSKNTHVMFFPKAWNLSISKVLIFLNCCRIM